MKGFRKRVLALAIATAAVMPLVAFAAGDVHVALTAQAVSVVNGRDVYQPADKARPGDVLEYRATYRNDGRTAVRDFQATLPIPRGLEFVPGTATPGALASLDGTTFEPMPIVRKVRTADGHWVNREVPASEYRSLRWPLGQVAGGAQRVVVARARISPLQAAAVTR